MLPRDQDSVAQRSAITLRAGNPMLADRPAIIGIFLARVIQPPPTTGNGVRCSISVLNAPAITRDCAVQSLPSSNRFTAFRRIGKVLLGQADLLAKSFHPRIAVHQGEFRKCECPAYPNGSLDSHAIQSFESAVFVAQAGVN